jgi:hypothetical protein
VGLSFLFMAVRTDAQSHIFAADRSAWIIETEISAGTSPNDG